MSNRSWSGVLLCLLLIIGGGILLLHLTFADLDRIVGVMAIAAGILLLVGK